MYWPIGTPRIYASSHSSQITHTQDGSVCPSPASTLNNQYQHSPSLATSDPSSQQLEVHEFEPATPLTPATPGPPGVQAAEPDSFLFNNQNTHHHDYPEIPLVQEPILALRVARTGHIFGTITSTSMTIWQTKPSVVLASIFRSKSSIETYGKNVDLLLRPDSAIFVLHTSLGYLITYSLATDSEARVYKPHFSNYSNVQRRRQSHVAGMAGMPPDQIMWGPGEGAGLHDVSVRFRMVIKVDAGIESAIALDDELVVATRKPAAIQCIRWTPDKSGNQTRTELLSRMGWVERKASIVEMTYDRPMNLSTWTTSDGRAYAVQRQHPSDARSSEAPDPEANKRLFRGYCFHVPKGVGDRAIKTVINARFSLIAVGCTDSFIRVYTARDYAGNIPASHIHYPPASESKTGRLITLSYSPDGYCLFAGFQHGWATWSVYGKVLSWSFGSDHPAHHNAQEEWLSGIVDAAWIGGGAELLLVSSQNDNIWSLEMARSGVTGCYNAANLSRTVLQTLTSIMVFRGYDLPDLATISTEPFLWHTSKIPASYLLNQWPIKQTAVSSDGRYVAVAGRRGLAHYSVNSGRWKTFANETMENEFQVRGGMCWYQHILVAAVDANKSYQLRLFSRETALDTSLVLHVERVPSPIVLITSSGEDSLLVYTHDNVLHHYIFAPGTSAICLIQVGQIAFNGIIRSPARVRGLTWLVPDQQLIEGDPSSDVMVASVLFLVDGKLVLLRPSVNNGQLKYDMRVIAQNVEFHVSMRDQPLSLGAGHSSPSPSSSATGTAANNTLNMANTATGHHQMLTSEHGLRSSLWIFDGSGLRTWTSIEDILNMETGEGNKDVPVPVSVPVDFYPLSILLGKGIALGVEVDLVQRRDVSFSHFRFAIRTQLILPDILRTYLTDRRKSDAAKLAQNYQHLEYFSHALEILLHRVLDEEVDTAPKPEDAVLPRVLSLLSSTKDYLDIVLRCTRKTEVRQWRTLFAYLPPPQELFEESLQRGSLKTAGGYLIILHTLEELGSAASEQSVRLFSRAIKEKDWELCKELARFLAALDETGETLKEAMRMVTENQKGPQKKSLSRLELPVSGLSHRKDNQGGDSSDGLPTSDDGSVSSDITS